MEIFALTHLEIAHGTAERVVGEVTLLVQKFAGLSVGRRYKKSVVEALLQFLQHTNKRRFIHTEAFKSVVECFPN